MTDKVAISASVEAEAAQMAKKMVKRETMTFVLGFVLYATVELVRLGFFENAIKLWTLRGIFMLIVSLSGVFLLVSIVSMQSSLKSRCSGDAITQKKICYEQLLMNKDDEGLRLLNGIAFAGSIASFISGMLVALALCNTFLI